MQIESNGNIIQPIEPPRQPVISEETESKINDKIQEYRDEAISKEISEKDKQREVATTIAGHQSKKDQIEIYLAVATDKDVELTDTRKAVENLQDIKKENDVVKNIATYKENQDFF